ncbi:helix-turn-helix domain-containing protein [Ascidiimonas sp. W6]|uniref:helix-turn-helix domain-containing protein n=1 Tax=Ascidiimonas meishanensis TaxID=3128903 RepID=UPI0030EC92FF
MNDWVSILLLLGVIQGFFLSIFLPKHHHGNKTSNKELSILLFVSTLSLLIYLLTVVYQILPFHTIAFIDSLAFLFGPFIYNYFKAFLFPNSKTRLVNSYYFIPAALHVIYGITFFLPIWSPTSNFLRIEWFFIFPFLIAWTLYYFVKTVVLLLRFKKNAKSTVSFKPKVWYLSIFLIGLLLGDLISILFALDFFFGVTIFPFTKLYIGWIIIPFLIYLVSYISLNKPEILNIPYQLKKLPVKENSKEEIRQLKMLLEKTISENQLYLNPTLSLQELASEIGIGATKLSNLINSHYHQNFYDFVNSYRLKHFIEKLKNQEHKEHTLLGLAYEVGFNSKTTFNKSFKQVYQCTPSQYVNQIAS